MEASSLFVGIILMMVAAIGIFLYAALVIAIPVCRLLDWFFMEEPKDRMSDLSRLGRAMSATMKRLGEMTHGILTHFQHNGERK